MKARQILSTALAIVTLVAGAAIAQEAPAVPALRTWIVVDTSPSNDDVLDELQAVAKALVGELQPGDRVRVIAAAKSRPRLLLTEQVPKEEAGRAEIVRAVTEIKPAWMQKANLAVAMGVPCSTLEGEGPGRPQPDLVVVLTNGLFDDQAADGVLQVTGKLKGLGAMVIVTGVEGANRTLLVEATRGGVEFHDLSHCDPSEWVSRARKGTPPPLPAPSTAPVPAKEAPVPSQTGRLPVENSDKELVAVALPPSASGSNPTPLPDAAAHADSVPTIDDRATDRHGAEPTHPAKQPELVEIRPQSVTQEIQGTDHVEIRLSVSTSPKSAPAPADAGPPSQAVEPPANEPAGTTPAVADSSSPSEFGEPKSVQEDAATPSEAPNAPVAEDGAIPGSTLKTYLQKYWLVGTCLVVLLVLLGLVAFELRRSREDTSGSVSGTGEAAARPGTVIAVVDGKEHLIGPANGPVQVHIGSGSRNTLRISAPGVEERHAELIGNGAWTFRNLSGAPAEINGAVVAPGKCVRLEFPALVRLGKAATVRLYVRPAAASVPAQPSLADGNREEHVS